jgi:hypothetical protein
MIKKRLEMLRNVYMIKVVISLLMVVKKLLSPKKEWLITLYLSSIREHLLSTHG